MPDPIPLAELKELIAELRSTSSVVEGKNDKAALEALGFVDIHTLDAPIYKMVERFERGDHVQILTDLDKKGKQLYRRLYHEFAQRGVRVDNRLREALFRTDLSHIEGFDSWLERQE